MDEGYRKIRGGSIKDLDEVIFHDNPEDATTWEDLQSYAAQGHEIASHTVTHPRLAVLDEANLRYELEASKVDIQQFLGEDYTFFADCTYGTEDERVVEYAFEVYPSLRNRMPTSYQEELNRSSLDPAVYDVPLTLKTYILDSGNRVHQSTSGAKIYKKGC